MAYLWFCLDVQNRLRGGAEAKLSRFDISTVNLAEKVLQASRMEAPRFVPGTLDAVLWNSFTRPDRQADGTDHSAPREVTNDCAWPLPQGHPN